jgi:hypothetical protein
MTPRSRSVATAAGVLLLFALPLLSEIVGSRLLVFRDAHITHWPWRRAALSALDSGRVPFLNEGASGVQPLLANPNAVLLYPTLLLERVVSPAAAFNLHYLLSVAWAFLGARLLSARLGASPGAALFAGAAYAFSGMVLSYSSAFANSGPSAAWLPWCAAAALGVARAEDWPSALRAAAATGLAFGLQVYAGEPAISLLTAGFTAFLVLVELFVLAEPRGPVRSRRWMRIAGGGLAAAAIGAAFSAALLLPLRAVFPLTYRGQHLYSESAFGAASFRAARALEWLFPRLSGDPSVVGGRSGPVGPGEVDLVYIWCVTLGVLPLLAVAGAGLRREFWTRRTTAIAAGGALAWLFSFGLSLPFARLLFAVGFLRRLRYPIKFYLLATLALALLAGFAADRMRDRRPARRLVLLLVGVLAVYGAAAFASAPGGWIARSILAGQAPGTFAPAETAARLLSAIRGDALVGAVTVVALASVWLAKRPHQPGHALALLVTALSLPWALPLFVSASVKESTRRPALVPALHGSGRLYVSPKLPEPDLSVLDPARPGPPRYEKFARTLTEELVPATGLPFGVSYLFDHDPDGSYGWYNRIANEAAAASRPEERSRLLRAFGARWALAGDGERFPLFHPVTGVVIGGRNLVLHVLDDPLPEVRWAGRAFYSNSLSGAIDLVRSEAFDPATDVVLPFRGDVPLPTIPPAGLPPAVLSIRELTPERAVGSVEANSPGYVVFARTYFPAWRARVDGRPVRPLVANTRDVAVPLPSGRHELELEWDRGPFHRGVIAQAVALAAALAIGIFTSKVKAKPPTAPQQQSA